MSTNQWNSNQDADITLSHHDKKASDKSSKFWLLGAFAGAVGATFCCLPALLFLLFGSSFGLLVLLAPLEAFRPLLTVLALLSFAFFVWARFFRKSCALNKRFNARSLIFVILAFLGLLLLLFYPEILGAWYLNE